MPQQSKRPAADSTSLTRGRLTRERPGGVSIVAYKDGPYIVRGDFQVLAQDGTEIDAGRRTIALCRCGKSRTRPFCDGTHQLVRFRAPAGPEGEL